MKHKWEYKKLGEVCVPKSQIERASKLFKKVDEIKYFDISSIDNIENRVLAPTTYIFGEAPSRAQQKLEQYDIVYSLVRPNLKNIAMIDESAHNMVGSSGFAVLRGTAALPRFLYWIVLSPAFTRYILSKTTGAAYPAVNDNDVRTAIIPVPSKEEQKKIVAELDKINKLIALRKKQLKEFDNLAQSLFFDTFGDPIANPKGWPVVKLKELSLLITNGNTPKGGEKVYVESGITFLRSQNVWRNCLRMDDVAYIDEETNFSMKGSILHHNDLLITKTGRVNTENSSLGRTALFTGEDNTANINGHVYLVRLKENTNPKFVLYILISEQFRELIRKVCVGAIDKRQLNRNHIEDFPIICPPKELQDKYAKQIEAIEAQKFVLNESLKKLQTLFDSRMDYWFN